MVNMSSHPIRPAVSRKNHLQYVSQSRGIAIQVQQKNCLEAARMSGSVSIVSLQKGGR